MPITLTQPLAVGNAIRVFLDAPVSAKSWRLLRKPTNDITGFDDPDASIIIDGTDLVEVDCVALSNGAPYFYQLFGFDGSVWQADGAAVSATAAATFEQLGVDVLGFVRDRIDYGLQELLNRGVLQHQQNHIQVLTAPPLFDETAWPVVTIHLTQEAPSVRALGEQIGADEFDAVSGKWHSVEGWLARVQLTIIGWCLNPDERISLRKAIRDVVIANLPVFASQAINEVETSQSDLEDFQSFNAPVYQVMTVFNCIAPAAVGATDNTILDVDVTVNQ